MSRLVVKNTFLEFTDVEEVDSGAGLPESPASSGVPKRARSLDTVPCRDGVLGNAALPVAGVPGATSGGLRSRRMCPDIRLQLSPKEQCQAQKGSAVGADWQLDRLNQLFGVEPQQSPAPPLSESVVSAADEGRTGPSDEELRALQRMLGQAMCAAPTPKPLRTVLSNGSLSTMASDDIRSISSRSGSSLSPKRPGLCHVWSSGSVSSLASGLNFLEEEEIGRERGVSQASSQSIAVPAEVTTMMIRNVPNRYTQRELSMELECLGFGDSFDFLYLPVDRSTVSNVGYCFVNFVNAAWAARCAEVVNGHMFSRHQRPPNKIATVSVANVQGLEANLMQYDRVVANNSRLKKRRPVVAGKALARAKNHFGQPAAIA